MSGIARIVDEGEAWLGWIAPEPAFLRRASHALADAGRVWIVDPVDVPGIDARIRALGEPAAVLQLLDRHARDSAAMAARLGVPHLRLPARVEGAPFAVLPVVRWPGWREIALWWPARRVLVVADALGTAGYFLAPGERLAVHPFLRLAPPRALAGLDPLHVLVGHGEGVHGAEAAVLLRRALGTARRRIPRWIAGLPGWRRR